MVDGYPWFAMTEGAITQGEIIRKCPIAILPQNTDITAESIDVSIDIYDVIILSQACDLEHRKVDHVVVCGLWDLTTLEETNPAFKGKKALEELRRGNRPAHHLLNNCTIEGGEFGLTVVDFRATHSVPFDFLSQIALHNPPRIRLLPPYREHLSQAFARFFMRVGLPIDIPPFT